MRTNPPRPHWRGFSFCLAPADGAGLFFLPYYNTAPYKRLQRVLRRQCSYTAHAAKQRTGLYRRFSCYLPNSTATNTRLTQVAIIPPVQRWDVSQRPDGPSAYQIPPTSRTLYRPAQPPYYNKVYNGAGVRPRYRSMPDGATHCRPCKPGGAAWHPPPGRTVQQQGRGRRRGTIGGSRRISFRAFAR